MAIDPLAARSAAGASAPRPPVAHPDPAGRSGATEAVGGEAAKAANSSDAAKAANNSNAAKAAGGEEEMSFWDVLDIVNPLQHIPVVNSIYRAVTGDEIKPAMQIGGGILYGGVIGGMAAIANAVLQEATGKDLGAHVIAGLGFGDDAAAHPGAPVQIAGVSAAAAAPAQNPQPQQNAARPTASAAPPSFNPPQAAAPARLPAALAGGAVPAGGLSGGLAAAAGQGQPQGLDPTLVMNSGHTPGKMPKRDAMLASTMPKGSQTSNLERAAPTDRTGPVLPPIRNTAATASAAAGQTGQTTTTSQAAANPAAAVSGPAAPRDAMAETMLRNLAKYQAEKRAQTHTIRTSG